VLNLTDTSLPVCLARLPFFENPNEVVNAYSRLEEKHEISEKFLVKPGASQLDKIDADFKQTRRPDNRSA
jgi:hypothetical protein